MAQHLSPPLNILEIYGGAENQFQVPSLAFSADEQWPLLTHALTHSLTKQVKALKTKAVDILIATPGRLLHYLKQGEAGLDKPEQTVFVEDGTFFFFSSSLMNISIASAY